ncbi:MAG: M28 family peptidase [Candidatus Thermoplasmatota archaeon]
MRILAPVALALLVAASASGCLNSGSGDEPDRFTAGYPRYEPANDLYHFEFGVQGGLFHFDFAPGAIGKAWNKGDGPLSVGLPDKFLLISGDNGTSGSFSVAPASFELQPGVKQFFLAPPSAQDVTVSVAGESFTLSPAGIAAYQESETQIVSGENAYVLEEYQEANFPHRTPGMPNYGLSITYFAQYFRDLGYDVDVDPYNLQGQTDVIGCVPVGLEGQLCPESMANIVAMKPGTEDPSKVIFVAGGHYDMVPGTTHAAFDDTSGVVTTMELARALAPYDFRYTIAFGLWGGEEDGILGSQFWVQSNPEMRARILSYWNLDVVGMSWPAPLSPQIDPIVISAGPDVPSGMGGATGDPISQDLLGWAQTLQQDWFGFPEEVNGTDVFYYEGIASGQASGYAAVNAQSDHTPFMAAGIPAYFIFNGDALGQGGVGIHNEKDTLANLTKYSVYGTDTDFDADFSSIEDFELGRQALADSWETVMLFPFYHAVLTDLGVYVPPATAARVPAGIPPA